MANRTVSVRLMAEVGQYVGGMNTAAAATMRLGETATKSSAKAKSGFDIASRGAMLMGAAVVGGMAVAVSKSMEFEKAMSAAAAATSATGTALGDLRDAAMQAGADTQYSATEAAQAITEMAKAGVSAADILSGGLDGALALAAAGQLDVAKAAEIASVAMTQFGLSGDQIPHVADLLAAGAGKAMGSVEDLGAALNQSGLIADAAGLSIEETTGTLAAFASAGLIGSDAGTSFKTMLQSLQAPSGKSAELMAELGINMYDTQGNMLGVSDMAGVLHDRLSGLTEEQRNSALATIFGSDAVRAANVLYNEGSAGIAEWTSKVNDAGYAADQAAKLNDNLAGDLERLGGSVDTLLISLGEGAQGPLRELVQMLGGLVDGITGTVEAFSDLPGPVQAGIAAMALWAVAGGKVTGALDGIRTKMTALREEQALQRALFAAQTQNLSDADRALGGLGSSVDNTRQKFGMAKAAAGEFARAIGPELGIALVVGGLTLLADDLGKITDAGGDAKARIDEINESIREMDAASRVDATKDSINELRDALAQSQAVLDAGGGDQGWFANLLGSNVAIAGQAAAMTDAAAAVDAYQAAIDGLEEKQRTADETTRVLAEQFGITRQKVLELANTYGIDLSVGAQTAAAMLYGAEAAAVRQGESAQGATLLTDDYVTGLEDVATAADDAKRQTDLFKLSLDVLTGAHVSMIEAEAALQESLAAGTDAMEGLEGSVLGANGELNLQSEAGREASDVLLGVRDSGNQLIATMIEQGASSDDVRAKDAQLRQAFVDTARQMGISEAAALDLADQILGIPEERRTTIDADTRAASSAVADFQRQVDGLHGKTVAIQANWANGGSLNGSMRFDFAQGGVVDYFANGGISENHVAQIAPAGAMRLWAEPETGGEAYIPLSPAKRSRSLAIWQETGRRLNAYADGGIDANPNHPMNIRADFSPIAAFARTAAGQIRKLLEPATGMVGALNWARTQVGRPYVWGGVGPGGYDCSGFMSALTNVIRGRSPFARLGATSTFPWSGFLPGYGSFTIGSTPNAGGGIGHMAGTLLGVNVESAGGVGVRTGSSARGASDGLFSTRAHLAMASGGVIREPVFGFGASGRSYSFAERGPETVLPGIRSREFSGGGRGGGGIDYKRLAAAVAPRPGVQIGTIQGGPSADTIARTVIQTQRTQEFLHG